MPLHIVRLGSPRAPGEGLRIGTVRRTPQAWQAFARRYRREMAAPDAAHAIALLAAPAYRAGTLPSEAADLPDDGALISRPCCPA